MQNVNKQELDKLMNRYGNDLNGLKVHREQEKVEQDAFLKSFEKLGHEIIWPVLVDIGNQLNQYGHDYHIDEEKEYVDATAHAEPSTIKFNIYPATLDKSMYKPESTPYVSFFANKFARKVGIAVSTMMPGTGGVIGSHGEFDPSQITKDFVEKEVVEVLKRTLIFNKQ